MFSFIKGDYHPKKLFLHTRRYQSEALHVYRFRHAEHESEEIFWVWLFVSMETVKQWDFGSCLGERPTLHQAKILLYFCDKMSATMWNYGLIYFFCSK